MPQPAATRRCLPAANGTPGERRVATGGAGADMQMKLRPPRRWIQPADYANADSTGWQIDDVATPPLPRELLNPFHMQMRWPLAC